MNKNLGNEKRSCNFLFAKRLLANNYSKVLLVIILILSCVVSSYGQIQDSSGNFQVVSLSDNNLQQITLQINIDTLGNAEVAKTETLPDSGNLKQQYMLGRNISITTFAYPDYLELSVDSLPPGFSIYWIPIDLDYQPTQQMANSVTFYCIAVWESEDEASKCDEQSSCDVTVMMAQPNVANVYCHNTCSESCILVRGCSHFGQTNYNGGVYVIASSITYLN